MEVQSEALQASSDNGFFKNLLERRIPQIFLFYIGSVWTIFGIVQWIVNRYVLSPYLEELFLFAALLLLPAVLIVAYGHGAPGKNPWRLYEKASLSCNVLIAAVLLFMVFKDKDLGSAQEVIQVVDTEGNEVERVVPKQAFRKRIALFFFDNESQNPELDWLQAALPSAMETDLKQDLFLTVQNPILFADRFQKAGFADGLNIPSALKRSITSDYRLDYFLTGSIQQEEGAYVINTSLNETERNQEIASHEYRGNDIFQIVDDISRDLKKDLDLPSKHIEDTVDLPATDILTGSEQALEAYSNGLYAYGIERNYPSALSYFETATADDPTFALAYIQKYVIELQQGQMQPALQSLGMAQQHSYRLTEQMEYLIKVAQLNLNGNQEQALEAAIQWSTLFPNDMLAHQISALLHTLRRQFDEAITAYRKILAIDPFEDQVALQIGQLLRETGRTDEAIEHYENYISQYPDKNDGYKLLAQVYQETGDLEKELEIRKKALSINPNDPAAARSLGDVEKRLGNFDQALSRFEAAVSISQTPQEQLDAYLSKGHFHWFRGEYGEAIAAYDQALVIAEASLPLLLQLYHKANLTSEYYTAGLRDRARGFADAAYSNPLSRQFPDMATVSAYAVSYIAARENNPEQGLRALDEAEALVNASGMSVMKPTLLYARADLHKESAEFEQAKEAYKQYLELEPASANGLRRLGEVLFALQQYEEARTYFTRSLSYSPSSPLTLLGLGKVANELGNRQDAVSFLEKALLAWAQADDTSTQAQEARELLATLQGS